MTLPNLLSILRLTLAPVLLLLAWAGLSATFIGVLIVAFLLDLIDGPIARKFNQVSALGPKLDSYADFSIYLCFLIGACLLWPGIVRRELPFIVITGASIVLPAVFGLIKFRRATSYHTWLVKCAAMVMAPSAVLLFINGPAWPFRTAAVISAVAALEEIVITFMLHAPRSDVGSLVHILRDRKH